MTPSLRYFAVPVLGFLCSLPLPAYRNSAPVGLGLHAEVSPVLAFQPRAFQVSAGGLVATISSISEQSVLVETHVSGNGSRQNIRVPLSVVSNVKTFLFRASSRSKRPECLIQLVSDKNSAILSRKSPVSSSPTFAMALNQPVHSNSEPLVVTLEIEVGAVLAGEDSESSIIIDLANSR